MSTRRAAHKALDSAETYGQWLEAANALDAEGGGQAWRQDDAAPELAVDLMRNDIGALRKQAGAADLPALAETLHESIYRHQTDITAPHLYAVAKAGTKHIVEDYLQAVERALDAIVTAEHPAMPLAAKLAALRGARDNLGRPALLLSGGAAMGFFHLGVVKALFDQGLLPDVICGASIGALIAAGVCARDDAQLAALLSDVDSIYRVGIRFLPPRQMWNRGGLLDQAQLRTCIINNVGDVNFAQAKAVSGRSLAITVSPARARQKPRVLSAKTSPDVLLTSAVLASAAVPGLFAPVALQQRRGDGNARPYLPAERWVDGTFQGDLPTQRLARLFNVNANIVSQVNPHVVPFLVGRHGRGAVSAVADLALSSARAQAVQVLKVAQARVRRDGLHHVLEHGRLLAEQGYKGDTTIYPPLNLWMYRNMLSNPSTDDLRRYIRMGERATWPKLALIRNQTRIQRAVANCLARLDNKSAG
ncbi:DUF3336 domain-containing protein [bacterium]|nr:DUF3336 domain-containing protein [bacterium]